MPELVIFGASGHAKWAKVIGQAMGRTPRLVDREDEADILAGGVGDEAHVGIGDNALRERIYLRVKAARPDLAWPALIHPDASIFGHVGPASLILPTACIGPDAKLGIGCVVYSQAVCEHDSQMADFSSLAPGACLGGNVSIGARTFIGIGASVQHGKTVGNDTVIGSGANVIGHIAANVTAIGNPARIQGAREKGDRFL